MATGGDSCLPDTFALVKGIVSRLLPIPRNVCLVEQFDPNAVFYAFGKCRFPLGCGGSGFLQRHKTKELLSRSGIQP